MILICKIFILSNTDGNDEALFDIIDADDESSTGVIRVAGQIDREKVSHALLTVKCFKKREVPRVLHKKYNKTVRSFTSLSIFFIFKIR